MRVFGELVLQGPFFNGAMFCRRTTLKLDDGFEPTPGELLQLPDQFRVQNLLPYVSDVLDPVTLTIPNTLFFQLYLVAYKETAGSPVVVQKISRVTRVGQNLPYDFTVAPQENMTLGYLSRACVLEEPQNKWMGSQKIAIGILEVDKTTGQPVAEGYLVRYSCNATLEENPTFSLEAQPYYPQIVVSSDGNGTATSNLPQARPGDTVKLSAVAALGYRFQEWRLDADAGDEGTYIDGDDLHVGISHTIYVTAVFVKINYTVWVSADPTEGGAAEADRQYAHMGDEVNLSHTENTGWKFMRWSNDGGAYIANDKFTMPFIAPGTQIGVVGHFEQIDYSLTRRILPEGSYAGTVTINPATAHYQDQITITVGNIISGWQLKSLVVTGQSTGHEYKLRDGRLSMPAENVLVSATFEQIEYNISLTQTAGGVISCDRAKAVQGTKCTLSHTVNPGYRFVSYTVTGAILSGNEFTMRFEDVTVTATFEKIAYSITAGAQPAAGGSVSASAGSAVCDTQITLTQTPSPGYYFDHWDANVAISNNTFVMPTKDVTVRAVYGRYTYTVKVENTTGGTAHADTDEAQVGDAVHVHYVPDAGWEIGSWNNTPQSVEVHDNVFIMPAENVTLRPLWQKSVFQIRTRSEPQGVRGIYAERGGQEVSSANKGDVLTLRSTPHTEGYVLDHFVVYPENKTVEPDGQYTMPGAGIEIVGYCIRRSTVSMNKQELTAGEAVWFKIDTEDMAYTHDYLLSFGTGMQTEVTTVAAGVTSVKLTIPMAWCNGVTDSDQKTGGYLRLRTYKNGTLIGTHELQNLTFLVPMSVGPRITSSGAEVVHTVGGVTYADVGNGIYVQEHCAARYTAEAEGAYGSEIVSMSISVGGYSGSLYNDTQQGDELDFTTGLLSKTGQQSATITATDSRGRMAFGGVVIHVQPYSPPTGSLRCWRVDVNGDASEYGEYGKYTLTTKKTNVGTNQIRLVKLACRGQEVTSPQTSGDLMPGNRLQFNVLYEFEATLTIQDDLETTVITAKLPSARFVIHVSPDGYRLAFMKAVNTTRTLPAGKSTSVEIPDTCQFYIGNETLEDFITRIASGS